MKGPPSKSRWPTWKIVTVVCAIAVLGVIELSLVGAFLFSRSGKGRPMQMAQANRRQIEQDRRQTLEPVAQPKPKPKPTGPQAAAPAVSVTGGVFTNNFSVTLKAKSGAAVIRYTLNGRDPEEDSAIYSAPLAITNTVLLKARCFEAGLAPSATLAATYTFLDERMERFSSNLPFVIIDAFRQRIQPDTAVPVSVRFINVAGGRSSLLGAAEYDGRAEVKQRGFSSLRLPKQSLTLKLKEDGEKVESALFGLPSESDWVLYAPYSDKTLMRDVLAYELGNRMGRYAPRTRFVEVFINRYGGKLTMRDYAGVYVLEEKIKRDKNRVNIAKLGPEDNSEPNITGGYIIKRDHTEQSWGGNSRNSRRRNSADQEMGFRTSRGMELNYVDPKESDLTPAQKQWMSGYMNDLESALHGSKFKSPTEGYAKYLDVDSFIDQFWLVEMSKNIDGFRYSCFMHKDRGGKLKLEPLWDWNLSFGNADYHEGWMTEGWYYPLLRETEVAWFRRLVQDPEFEQRHIDRWGELRQTLFAPPALLKRVDELAAQLNEAQARNFERWPILGVGITPNYYVGNTYAEEVAWMKKWIRQRIAWIDSQFLATPTVSTKDAMLTLRGPGELYYTLDGTDPRLPGGSLSKKARRYEAPLKPEPNTKLFVRARQKDRWSAPALTKPN